MVLFQQIWMVFLHFKENKEWHFGLTWGKRCFHSQLALTKVQLKTSVHRGFFTPTGSLQEVLLLPTGSTISKNNPDLTLLNVIFDTFDPLFVNICKNRFLEIWSLVFTGKNFRYFISVFKMSVLMCQMSVGKFKGLLNSKSDQTD